MRTAFLITGLPRTRSAWLSCLMTYGNSVCLHDVTGRADSIADVVDQMVAIDKDYVGLADCGILPFWDEFKAEFKQRGIKVSTVLVNRPVKDVTHGLVKAAQLPGPSVWALINYLRTKLPALADGPQSANFITDFHELDSAETCRILSYEATLSGMELPRHHIERMLRMKVEVLPEIMYKSARQAPSGLAQRLSNELESFQNTLEPKR